MSTKNHHDGKKHAGKHTTVIDLAAAVVKKLEALPVEVKIVAGIIKRAGNSRLTGHLKLVEEPNGWKITVRGNTYVQELHVYTKHKRVVAEYLDSCYDCTVIRS